MPRRVLPAALILFSAVSVSGQDTKALECGPSYAVIDPASNYGPQIVVEYSARGRLRERTFAFPSISRCKEADQMLREVLGWINPSGLRVITSNCDPPSGHDRDRP